MSATNSQWEQVPGALPPGCDTDSVLTLEQMALWIQVHPDSIKARCAKGEIPHWREGNEYRFHPKSYLTAKGQIASRWDAALAAWNRITAGLVNSTEVKRAAWREFKAEFGYFETNGAKIPGGVS